MNFRATVNIKPVLKSSWAKFEHRRCPKWPGGLKHITISYFPKSIIYIPKKNMKTKKFPTLGTSHALVLPKGLLE